ncbi:maleate cis-trans isomerase family protein [Algihabitans albus]|uniref:maleate cis-trans isomerase family protein n=1 Tax=Algihabitans albus TaxID=2164067 RepID=UPI000E5CE27C|nr:aspartate/glutamate racemase family protein [Algihabitans albus]
MAVDAASLSLHPDDRPRVDLEHLPFTLDAGFGAAARLGLIVLATDGTVEQEFHRILAQLPDVALFQSRIWNDAAITPETLKAMEARIPDCAKVLLPGSDLDCVAYGCTSASMVIGPERVRDLVLRARAPKTATNPALAALAAFQALGMQRIALLTPYLRSVNRMLRDFFQSRGIQVPVMGSFNEGDDPTVARIDAASLRAAAERLAGEPDVDGLFVSCTSMRLVEAVEDIEAAVGKPVTSSNHALAWHALRLSGVETALPRLGALFRCGLD